MVSLTALEQRRAEKVGLCDYCGEPAHKTPLMCPRIQKIRYEDEVITIYFTDSPVVITGPQFPTLKVRTD